MEQSRRDFRRAFVVVDNANTFIGAQRTQSGDNRRLRLNLPSLDKLLVGQCLSHGFGIGNKLAFGVVKPSSRVIEQSYQNLGYQTHFQVSTTKQDTNGELKKALMSILESKPTSSLSCIALVSGDGSCRGGNSIPDILENGLKNGWHCILFAWNHTLSKQFLRLNERYGRQMRIIYLDDYRASIMMFSTPPSQQSPPQIRHQYFARDQEIHSRFHSPDHQPNQSSHHDDGDADKVPAWMIDDSVDTAFLSDFSGLRIDTPFCIPPSMQLQQPKTKTKPSKTSRKKRQSSGSLATAYTTLNKSMKSSTLNFHRTSSYDRHIMSLIH